MYYKTIIFILIIFLTKVSFSQWTFVGFVTGVGYFPIICAVDCQTIFIGGGPNGSPKIYRSTNGGATWTSIEGTGILNEITSIWFVNINTGFAGTCPNGGTGENGRLYKTTNGGLYWSEILNSGCWNNITFSKSNPLIGIAAGTNTNILKTNDGGNTWITQSRPQLSFSQNSAMCIDSNFYGLGGNSAPARVGITSNGGISWIYPTLTGSGGTYVSSLTFSDDKLRGFASSNSLTSTISKTIDGGLSWTSQSIGIGVTGYCNLKWIHGTNIIYLTGSVGAGGVVKRSTDGGNTWTQMSTSGVTDITHFDYYKNPLTNSICLYAVAGDGSVIKYTDNSIVGVISANTIPSELFLSQNYPNPFNPSTKIKFDIPTPLPPFRKGGTNVSLKIYNVLGKEVATLVNEQLKPGMYEVEWNGSNFASGVYYYKLITGDFVETKRMVLVK